MLNYLAKFVTKNQKERWVTLDLLAYRSFISLLVSLFLWVESRSRVEIASSIFSRMPDSEDVLSFERDRKFGCLILERFWEEHLNCKVT